MGSEAGSGFEVQGAVAAFVISGNLSCYGAAAACGFDFDGGFNFFVRHDNRMMLRVVPRQISFNF